MDRDDFTTVYVSKVFILSLNNTILKAGKLCQVKKFILNGLDHLAKETILGMTPVLNQNKTTKVVQPLHKFIQDYNGKQFLVMIFHTRQNTTFCHFNGTEKKIEFMALPKQFGNYIVSYCDKQWVFTF